ncbi:SMR family transporter [Undibacterium sp. TJN19]|uniref:SMR family transporter n=1 Tax=Undibacterium sp. TJN19 TaxID=3413055 RepID=UPI003BF0A1F7
MKSTRVMMPIGIAYAIWSGVGWLLFGQKLDMPAILGMVLIVSGVIVMNVFAKANQH